MTNRARPVEQVASLSPNDTPVNVSVVNTSHPFTLSPSATIA
jgi:hypothetical protein